MIRVDIREKRYGDHRVLGRVAFDLTAGETLAILGPSGIGKSTLLRCIAGIDTRFEGRVERPESIAIVFQEPTLLPWRSVLRNVTLFHPGLSDEAALSMLDRVGIGSGVALFPGQLSLGQQRRLSLARAFAGRPELIILDEPFVSLDAGTQSEMIDLTGGLLADLRPATILVTHAPAEADRLATRIATLEGAPAELSELTAVQRRRHA